jgi:hypothetical protein
VLGASALGAAMLSAGGCTVLTNDGLPDDAGIFEGGDGGDGGGCTPCAANECLASWSVCLVDPACRAIHAGATSVCAPSASDAGVAPENAYRAFAACSAARTCGAACQNDCTARCTSGGPDAGPSCGDAGTTPDAGSDAGIVGDAGDGGLPPIPPPPTVDACIQCAASKCGDALRACAIGSECARYLSCVHDCTSESCASTCGTNFASGKTAAQELATCTTTGCVSACGF